MLAELFARYLSAELASKAWTLAGILLPGLVGLAGYAVAQFILKLEERIEDLEERIEDDILERLSLAENSTGGLASLVNDNARKIAAVEKTRLEDYETKAAWVTEVSKDLKHLAADVASLRAEDSAEERSVEWIDRDRAEAKEPPSRAEFEATGKCPGPERWPLDWTAADELEKAAGLAASRLRADGRRGVPPPPPEVYLGSLGRPVDVDAERARRLAGGSPLLDVVFEEAQDFGPDLWDKLATIPAGCSCQDCRKGPASTTRRLGDVHAVDAGPGNSTPS
jgi:hypothetical protein